MRRLAAVLFAAVFIGACSDQRIDQPTTPNSASQPTFAAGDPTDATTIEGLIKDLFGTPTSCSGNCNSALTRFQQIEALYTVPPPYDMTAVVSNTYDLIGYVIDKYHDGTLNDPPGQAGVIKLINLLLKYAGIDSSVCEFATDCNFTLYQPGSPSQILTSPLGLAGVNLPPGDGTVTQPTVISVYQFSDAPLTTQLDQYELRYFFSSSSGEEFIIPVTVEVCLGASSAPPDPSRLVLAHDVAEPPPYENIQILPTPSVTGFSLNCPNGLASRTGTSLHGNFATRSWNYLTGWLAAAFTPQPLQAAVAAVTTAVGGTTKKFSPFGAVDPIANISSASPTSGIWRVEVVGTISGSDSDAPKVRVLTPQGNPMKAIEVTFTVTGGGGTVTGGGTSTIVTTDNQGYATLGSWTLGTGVNTVQATGKVTPCAAPVATGTLQNCGTVVGVVTFTAEAAHGIAAEPTPFYTQTVPAGTSVGHPPAVKVTDNLGNGVAGVPVRFDAEGTGTITGNGNATQVQSIVVTTGTGGIASLDSWTLDPGVNTVSATAVEPANSAISLSLAGNPVTFTATGTTTTTRVYCPPNSGAGDDISHGFVYKSVAKNTRLTDVSLYMAANTPANFPNPYVFKLEVRQGSMAGTLLGSSQKGVSLKGNTSENRVTDFSFDTFTPVSANNSDLYFKITKVSGPAAATVFFASINCAPGATNCKTIPACGNFYETTNTNNPTAFYRKGLGIDLYKTP